MTAIFSVQDETGTVAQVTLLSSPSPSVAISVGDQGIYSGYPDDGNSTEQAPVFAALSFTVSQVLDNGHFSVSTPKANMADWPALGVIEWTLGANVGDQSIVMSIDGANAYINEREFASYHEARGNAVPEGATVPMIRAAIVKATDYIDNRYRFAGHKLLAGRDGTGTDAGYWSGWLWPYEGVGHYANSGPISKQSTEWPRRGVSDFNNQRVLDIPKAIKHACAELAIRVLNGTDLQPDYDASLVGAGGVVSSITKKVGPLETSISYDTAGGRGFFATFPVVDRLFSKSGLLYSGGGRTVFR